MLRDALKVGQLAGAAGGYGAEDVDPAVALSEPVAYGAPLPGGARLTLHERRPRAGRA